MYSEELQPSVGHESPRQTINEPVRREREGWDPGWVIEDPDEEDEDDENEEEKRELYLEEEKGSADGGNDEAGYPQSERVSQENTLPEKNAPEIGNTQVPTKQTEERGTKRGVTELTLLTWCAAEYFLREVNHPQTYDELIQDLKMRLTFLMRLSPSSTITSDSDSGLDALPGADPLERSHSNSSNSTYEEVYGNGTTKWKNLISLLQVIWTAA
jgi:hypothetical protein